MDQFYLENVDLYHKLVKAWNKAPPTRQAETQDMEPASPDMIVTARLRPLLDDELSAGFPRAVHPREVITNLVDIHDLYNHPRGRPVLKSFHYQLDKLFDSEVTTEDIYNNVVVDLLPFAWKGGIGTLFAYGQTGSGKTYTVGNLEKLVAQSLTDGSLEGSREIYLTIIDLAGNSATDLLANRSPVSILEDADGNTQLFRASEHRIHGKDDMLELIERATSLRRTASTQKNDDSSRSHAICRIRLKNTGAQDVSQDGMLYLVDLAGSEVARDITVHGADRMRETREINISLSVLKDCIRGKAESDALKIAAKGGQVRPKRSVPQPRVPFRQCALTKVLKHVFDPFFERERRTVVIACVNPSLGDVGPSKNTLRYAELLRVMVPKRPHERMDAARNSSQDPDPFAASIHFKKRIRPGMVVSWRKLPTSTSTAAQNTMLAMVLAPVGSSKKASEFTVLANTNDEGGSYLCSSVTPSQEGKGWQIHLWQHVTVSVDQMAKEIILEYDTTSRLYRTID